MVETAFFIGILPQQMYGMDLWEFNACVRSHNERRKTENQTDVARCWQTANFTGAAFWGKLKRLSHYLKNEKPTEKGEALTPEQMRAFDEKLKVKRGDGGGN